MTTKLIIKGHRVQLDGDKLSGDTYPIKQWIKQYLCGQWDGKAWTVDLKQVSQWTGTCIQPNNSVEAVSEKPTTRQNWYHYNEHGERELNEDY